MKEHDTVTKRPWGFYQVLLKNADCVVKRLYIYKGMRTSLQRHQHRREEWAVISGHGTVTNYYQNNDNPEISSWEIEPLKKNTTVIIQPKEWHRIEATFEDLDIIETWTGDKLEENDIERLLDDHGRV